MTADLPRLRLALLGWFTGHRRPLPFRESRDPYRVWVSEIMLQQTRVEAMLPRYRDFVARFPDLAALAAAGEDEVLAAWSGLGYYRRARSLHRAARELVGHPIPQRAADLRRLPGIGEYTAAAIASIAFDERVAAVDGNIRRVLARFFALRGVPGRSDFESAVRRAADDWMNAAPDASPGDWNQALMELGALICLPAAPRCDACPLASDCRAHAEGITNELGGRAPRPAPVAVRTAHAVIRDRRGRLLLFRRPDPPLKGLYEFPGGECQTGETPEDAVVRVAAGRYRLRVIPEHPLPDFRHTVMNRRLRVFPFTARCDGAPPRSGTRGALWADARALETLPSGSVVKKTLARLGN